MVKLRLVLFCLLTMGIIGYACKKEPIDSKLFVERHLVGIWPLRVQIETIIKNNNDTISPSDSTVFTPIDTTAFTSDLKFIRGTNVVDFMVDPTGENITFVSSPDSTLNIAYLRKTSFKLIYTRKETVGTDVISHIIERDFSK